MKMNLRAHRSTLTKELSAAGFNAFSECFSPYLNDVAECYNVVIMEQLRLVRVNVHSCK